MNKQFAKDTLLDAHYIRPFSFNFCNRMMIRFHVTAVGFMIQSFTSHSSLVMPQTGRSGHAKDWLNG